MEIIIDFYSDNLETVENFYIKKLKIFDLKYKDDDHIEIIYSKDNSTLKIVFNNKQNFKFKKVSIEVENSLMLYNDFKSDIKNDFIKTDYFNYNDDYIEYLSTPIGDYFCVMDPMGNLIIFFDRYND